MLKNWIPIWVVPIVIAMAIGTVWLRLSIVDTTYAIGQADSMIRTLQKEREQTEVKVVALKSPRRLEELARTKFNLGRPKPDQVVYFQ